MINVGFGQFEQTEQKIGSAYDNIQVGFFEAAKATAINAWNYNPTYSLWRKGEEFSAYNQDNTYLNKDELNKQYAEL